MSARFVYWMNVSVDGYIERAPGEHSGPDGPDWVRIDEELHREFNRRAAGMTLSVEGRVVRDMMDPYWPDARSDDSLSAVEREYAEIYVAQPKVLVSRTRTSAGHDTRVIGSDGDAIEQLARIREETEGDVGVGGADLASQLFDAGLIDELLLFPTRRCSVPVGRCSIPRVPAFDVRRRSRCWRSSGSRPGWYSGAGTCSAPDDCGAPALRPRRREHSAATTALRPRRPTLQRRTPPRGAVPTARRSDRLSPPGGTPRTGRSSPGPRRSPPR
ncbi:dihydrofolate reductase family protein [Curtobacterium sp. B8]|uniref:dihydrofolate reductase family protein n=1 Tax=Curtobacterium sp. B8 TaxID=95611 RepID=UPI0003B574B7|nr:dihydrofolate reductase family protein [Curtobacterium sp. B8]